MSLDKVHRERPAHVLQAILAGNHEALRAFGKKGQPRAIAVRMRNAKQAATEAKRLADSAEAQARLEAARVLACEKEREERMDAIMAEYHAQVRIHDAHAHAMRNLAGI
jgi:hypothetical protein